jgi:hypothetical protein
MTSISAILTVLLCVAIIGYLFSVMREKYDLMHQRVVIKSKAVTQKVLDDIDLKMFKLGRIKLFVGDEIRLRLKNSKRLKGIVLGAKKKANALCIVTSKDEIIEIEVTHIKKLSVLAKYGRLF